MDMIFSNILNLSILVGIILTFYFQGKKIQALTTLAESQKGVLDAVSTFFNIFKIDEVRKYVEMREESAISEAEKKAREAISNIRGLLEAQATEKDKRIQELLNLAFYLLLYLPPDDRIKKVNDNLTGRFRELIVSYLPKLSGVRLTIERLSTLDLLAQMGPPK